MRKLLFRISLLCLLALWAYGCASDESQAAAGSGGSAGTNEGPGAGGSDAAAGGSVGIDAGILDGLPLTFERSTPEQIGLLVQVDRTLADGARMTVRYKQASESTWQTAHPLLRIHPEWTEPGAPEKPVDSFAGSIFDLVPDTDYHVELTLEQPGKPNEVAAAQTRTRALPPIAPAATMTASPKDDLQAKFDALKPGDVLELENGTYDVKSLALKSSGTQTQPIYIRGKSREGVRLRNQTRVLQIQQAAHVVIENLTMEGSGTESGVAASSVGVSFWDGAKQEFVTFRDLDILKVDRGIIATGPVRSVLAYNLVLRGNNTWKKELLHSNSTWNDDGLRLPGEGNCGFGNTLHGFGDSLAVNNGAHSAAVYFYRNRITMTGDDAFEADYGTRNLGFYDNYITNAGTFLSLDPLWGGPLYCFRNVVINTFRGPYKLNNTNSGFMIYNNTVVRTEGRTEWGWVQFDNGALHGWSYRNNILVYRGTTGRLLAVEPYSTSPLDFTNNAWFPDGKIWWTKTGGSFASLGAARDGLPPTQSLFGSSTSRHAGDVLTTTDPFAVAISLGPDHLTEITTDAVPTLAAGASPKHTGVSIPNVTDGFAGAAPDMGAIIEGRTAASWGAKRP